MRALNGPVRMPKGPGELMKRVEKGYSAFFKIWNTSLIPKLMKMNKWYDTKNQLKVGDLVYFKKEDSELSSTWTIGKVSEVEKSKDGLVRRAWVQYQNFGENTPRFTDRSARSLIKLFHIDDQNWQDDMAEVEKLVKELQKDKDDDAANAKSYSITHCGGEGLRFRLTATSGNDVVARVEGVQHRNSAKAARSKLRKCCKNCCCSSHCNLVDHEALGVLISRQQVKFPGMKDRSYIYETTELEEEMSHVTLEDDPLMSLICAVDTDLAGDGSALVDTDIPDLVPGY